jgi:sugar phosphate isomerase/epimerase
MPDILAYSEHLNGEMLNEDDFDGIASISTKIRDLVEDLGLRIVMLQPFSRFEGWSKSEHSEERVAAFRRARGWIRVMESLGTDMLQVRVVRSSG